MEWLITFTYTMRIKVLISKFQPVVTSMQGNRIAPYVVVTFSSQFIIRFNNMFVVLFW